jgi:TonB-dependent receptor
MLVLSTGFLFAQKGTITGKVIEAESGFEVIGGNVLIQGTSTGTSTDLDGVYRLEVTPGTYALECSYIGFENLIIQDVVVKEGEITTVDVRLGEAAIQLDLGATIVARRTNNTEAAVLTIQKKAAVVLDAISSAQISKSGDNDVASAVKRVTGVTVEGGKYIYVRGLGDRYSKTTLNGATIPGLDPNKNTVQMDLFPTNLIDNILVYKTFSPNLPGDFTGGYVDIATKDFPTAKTITFNASVGYNTLATLNGNFLTYEGGNRDWLGFDDGTRAIPDYIQQNGIPAAERGANVNAPQAMQVTEATKSFANNLTFQREAAMPNYNLGFSLGDQKTVFGKQLGMIAAFTYQNSNEYYENGRSGIYQLTSDYESASRLTTQLSVDDTKGTNNTLWGAMFNTSLKLNANNKIGLSLMHNQSGITTARFQEGKKQIDDPDDVYQTRTWQFLERGLSTAQLKGKHVFGENNIEVSWMTSYALSSQDEPDLRFFTNRYRENSNGDRNYFLKPSSDRLPVRYFRSMEQNNLDNKVDVSIPFNQWNGFSSKFKFGVSYLAKDRDFREERYNYDNQTAAFSGDITQYLSEENLLIYDDTESMYMKDGDGVFLVDAFEPANNYDASQQVGAAYAMVELPLTNKLRAITGVRAEQTNIQFFSFSDDIKAIYPNLNGDDDIIDELDFLPSLNLNYELNDNMKVRVAYNRTLARPTFRELAPFESFDFMGGFILIGNPELQRTLVDNVDLRWEVFPRSGEIISVSGFYKRFQNPIERTYNPEAPNGEFTFRNVDNAFLVGSEVEVKKDLDFINEKLSDFSVATNFTYIYSQSDIDARELSQIRATNPTADDTREMFGQSPFVVNALLSYKNETGTNANLSYNISGARISYISIGGTPNIYELPRHSLNFNIGHNFENGLGVRISANNILNAKYQQAITFKGEDYFVQENDLGINFSFGIMFKIQ